MELNTPTQGNPLIDLIDGIHQQEAALQLNLETSKETYQKQHEWKNRLASELGNPTLSKDQVAEAFLHLSNLEWVVSDNYYDGYQWKTTEYFTLVEKFVENGHARLLRDMFHQHRQNFSSLHAVQLAGVLQHHNNKLLKDDLTASDILSICSSEEWTPSSFTLSCLENCQTSHLAEFKDHLMDEPDVVAFLLHQITSPHNPDMQDQLNYFTREDFFVETLPQEDTHVTDKEQQIGRLIRDVIPLMNNPSHIIAEVGRRVSDQHKNPHAQQVLLSYYQHWFEKLTLQQLEHYDYNNPFLGKWMDVVAGILPPPLTKHVAEQPAMQQYPYCGVVYVKGLLVEELGDRPNASQKKKMI